MSVRKVAFQFAVKSHSLPPQFMEGSSECHEGRHGRELYEHDRDAKEITNP